MRPTVLPGLSRVAVLWDVGGTASQLKTAREVARALGLEVQVLEVRAPADFVAAFDAARRGKAEALSILAPRRAAS